VIGQPGDSFLARVCAALQARAPRRLAEGVCETRAAVVLILREALERVSDVRYEALFVRRADRPGDPWSGHTALPGGRREQIDADLLETARREVLEETALDLQRTSFLGCLDDIRPLSAHLPSVAITPFVASCPHGARISLNDELNAHIWIPLASLWAPEYRGTHRRPGDPPRTFSAIQFAGHTIWGLTLSIVEDFIVRLRPPAG